MQRISFRLVPPPHPDIGHCPTRGGNARGSARIYTQGEGQTGYPALPFLLTPKRIQLQISATLDDLSNIFRVDFLLVFHPILVRDTQIRWVIQIHENNSHSLDLQHWRLELEHCWEGRCNYEMPAGSDSWAVDRVRWSKKFFVTPRFDSQTTYMFSYNSTHYFSIGKIVENSFLFQSTSKGWNPTLDGAFWPDYPPSLANSRPKYPLLMTDMLDEYAYFCEWNC